jgi:hypothetical protein
VKLLRRIGTSRLIGCSLLVLQLVAAGLACTVSSDPTKVGRNFSVQVVYKSKPLAGLQIELRNDPSGDRESHSLRTFATNDRGITKFTNVKPGPYFLGIKHAAFPQSIEIIVGDNRTKVETETITFEWPSANPISVQFVSGLINAALRTENPLNDLAHPTYGAVSEARLTLYRAVSGDLIESQTASASGAFAFQPLPAGLYLLKVEESSHRYRDVNGYIPIDVGPDAKDATLNVFLFPGICGDLGFENKAGSTTE